MGKNRNEPKASADRKGKPFNKKEDDFIKKNFLRKDYRSIARCLGRSKYGIQNRSIKLGLRLPDNIKMERANWFKTGHLTFNKGLKQSDYMPPKSISKTIATRFKNGRLPHNTINGNGVIRSRADSHTGIKYKYIKIANGKWALLHRHNYLKKHGKIPRGMCVVFIDGNQMNCRLKNLELITREENMIRNSIHQYPEELQTTIRALSKLKRQINKTAAA